MGGGSRNWGEGRWREVEEKMGRRKLKGREEGGKDGKEKKMRGEEEVDERKVREGDLYKDWPCTNEAHDMW